MTGGAIEARELGKAWKLYARPGDRLRELFSPSRRAFHETFWGLRHFTLSVAQGECVGLIGANGAGKSTALRMIAGKLRPSEGQVSVRGRLSSILELGTGFQPHLTARQNAFVNALFLGLRPREARRHVERMLDFAELGAHAEQPLASCSTGMQARLAFASLVVLEPEVLLIDEALATGDMRFSGKAQEHLRRLCRSGCTTLLASHDMGLVFNVCDRVIWLDHGRVRSVGAPRAVIAEYCEAVSGPASHDGRPRCLVLALEAAEGRPAALPVVAVEWVDGTGDVSVRHEVADELSWYGLVMAAASSGFSMRGATDGWGPAEERGGIQRRVCAPGTARQRCAYLALPLPTPPRAFPERLRLVLGAGGEGEVVVSLIVDGARRRLGVAAALGTNAHEFPLAEATA